jgi:hypothetical protein
MVLSSLIDGPPLLRGAVAGSGADVSWAKIKRQQAGEADRLAAVASGIGEYGIANACYRLAGILRRQAAEIILGSGTDDDWLCCRDGHAFPSGPAWLQPKETSETCPVCGTVRARSDDNTVTYTFKLPEASP